MAIVHLLLLIHGMWGHPDHLSELEKHVLKCKELAIVHEAELEVLTIQSIREESTYDGIDWGGERAAKEVEHRVKCIEHEGRRVTRFSVIGYSLGGLIGRYLVGILHHKGFFTKVQPVNFITIATPHIGMPRYPAFIYGLFASIGRRFLSRTGTQFYAIDNWANTHKPILQVMAEPGYVFFSGLAQFSRFIVYANAVNDIPVPYMTAAIECEDPFSAHTSDIEIILDPTYAPLIRTWQIPSTAKGNRKWKAFSLIPPYLRWSFPKNIAIYSLLPILVPTYLTLAVIRLSMDSHSSQARIKALEKTEAFKDSLIAAMMQVDSMVQDAGKKAVTGDDSGNDSDLRNNFETSSGAGALEYRGSTRDSETVPHAGIPGPVNKSVLSSNQRIMAASLNSLSNLQKETVWIHPVRNAHSIIVCRDVHRVEEHRLGEGVLRHIADNLVV